MFWFQTWSDTKRAVQPHNTARGLKLRKEIDCTFYVGKTKALISFAVTAKLICVFVFAYAKHWFSHDAAQMFVFQGGWLDEAAGLKKTDTSLVVASATPKKLVSTASWNKKVNFSNTENVSSPDKVCIC